MRGADLQVRSVGGMQQALPQDPASATLIENWAVDPRTKGLSSRIGYEKYRPSVAAQWAPWQTLGRIDSIFVMQQSTGGARQTILFEADGGLYMYVETGQSNAIHKLDSRTKPTATSSPSQYAQFGDRVIITNGEDSPVVVRPWPLPEAAGMSSAVVASCIRQLGFYGKPPAPEVLRVATIDAITGGGTPSSAEWYTGASTTNWYPVAPEAMSFPGAFGMGLSTGGDNGAENDFRFKVAFISDTGGISPLSHAAEADWEIAASKGGFRYCPTLRIPTGPPGTVARRIYATLNGEQDYFFVADVRNNKETLFHAFRRSASFVTSAPSETDSVPMPATSARFCAVFKDCLFLDGGRNEGNLLFYSKPGLIDQFAATDYLALSSGGGSITGLYAYYNNLVVLRENSVDVLTGTYPNFTVQTVTKQVVCRAGATLDAVPGVGVVFLAQDGVYAMRGGLDGGSSIEVVNIGAPVQRELERLTVDCAARAVGRYSPRERAYHLYLPADGNDRPNLGLVFHLDKQGWSRRTGFPVGCIDRTYNGVLVFGHHTGDEAGVDSEAGLFVMSSVRAMGGTLVADTYTPSGPPTSIYESAWHDFGDAQTKKQVQYVTLWIQTTGSVLVKLSHFRDFEYTEVSSNKVYEAQPPDQAAQPVYDTALIDTAVWQETRLVPIRIPVAQQSCSWFKFRIETTDDMVLIGYELEYVARGTQVIAGRRA